MNTMNPNLTKLWIREFDGRKEIRADFDNDRHHAVMIESPHRIYQVANALMILARNIAQDPHLAGITSLCPQSHLHRMPK